MFGKKAISFLGGSDEGFLRDILLVVENDALWKLWGLMAVLIMRSFDALFDEDLLIRRREA